MLLIMFWPRPTWAQDPAALSVEQLVSLALAASSLKQARDAALEEERADLSRQLIRPLPMLAIAQEVVFGSSQVAHQQATDHPAVRSASGDVSRYEFVRLERELVYVRAQRAQELLQYDEALGHLTIWMSERSAKELEGVLTPSLSDTDEFVGRTPLALQRLDELDQVFHDEYEAWGSPFLRGVTLGAGYRFARVAGDPGHGLVISVEVPLVVRDIDQPQQELLEAQRVKVSAERMLMQLHHDARQKAARERLEHALETLDELERTSASHLDVLTLATASYQAEEISVNDLLGTYQTETELALLRVDMAWEARRAELDRRRTFGHEDTP